MEVNMIAEAVKYMFLGMTTVFLFLILLIYILKLQTKLLNKFFPPKPIPAAPVAKSAPATGAASTEDEETVAAITAAITEFKKGS